MPIYEYQCNACEAKFEELVFGDEVPTCPHCNSSEICKLISRPCRHVTDGDTYVPSSSGGGGGCTGCAGGNCATCR